MKIEIFASGSSGNCYRISDGETSLLLDAGIPFKEIRRKCGFSLCDISGVLISHRHGDHAKAAADLLKNGVDVYAGADVFAMEAVKKMPQHHAHIIDSSKSVKIGGFTVLPFEVHHDVPNYGFYIRSDKSGEYLLYVTDTYYISQKFPKLNYIMCECNYDSEAINESVNSGRIPIELKARLVKSHMSIDTFCDFLKANDLENVKQIYLLHLSDKNSREKQFKKKVQQIAGCEVILC